MKLPYQVLPIYWIVLAILASAPPTHAQVVTPFVIDPSRSSIEFDSGDFTMRVGLSTFAFATMFAQSGTGPSPLVGHFAVEASPDLSSPTSVSILPGTTEVRVLSGNLVSPARGGGPGVSIAALGFEVADPLVGLEADVAVRDLVFAISGNLDVFSNPLGPNGLRGSMGWLHAAGEWDVASNTGFQNTVLAGSVPGAFGAVSSSASQVVEISPGVYEMTLPFSFFLFPSTIPGPLSDLGATMGLRGEIVATSEVPEPGVAGAVELGALALIAAGRRRSNR